MKKSQRRGALQVFSLNRLNPISPICPEGSLEQYILVTKDCRIRSAPPSLILGLNAPHLPIGASTVRRWIKCLLSDFGIDTSVYTAHSTRRASASKATSAGLSIESILRTGSWVSDSVFSKHYNHPINKETFGSIVLARETSEELL